MPFNRQRKALGGALRKRRSCPLCALSLAESRELRPHLRADADARCNELPARIRVHFAEAEAAGRVVLLGPRFWLRSLLASLRSASAARAHDAPNNTGFERAEAQETRSARPPCECLHGRPSSHFSIPPPEKYTRDADLLDYDSICETVNARWREVVDSEAASGHNENSSEKNGKGRGHLKCTPKPQDVTRQEQQVFVRLFADARSRKSQIESETCA